MGLFGSGMNASRTLQAFDRSLAIISFSTDGKILRANKIFCDAMGYTEQEILGRHHSMFVDPDYAQSQAYKEFWSRLHKGEFFVEEFRRFGAQGREVWIQGSYNPVRDRRGRVCGVTKIASIVTESKLRNAEYEAKVTAISRAQAIIEFDPSGTVLSANENFLTAFGYRLEEIVGRHHRMFVEPDFAASPAYQAFWDKLNRGELVAAEFKRLSKSGAPVWIEASYNPVFNLSGKIYKVVKFATVTTGRVQSVNAVAEGLAMLAQRRLSYRIAVTFAPAFETLKQNFNSSMDQVESAMLQLSTATTTIHHGVSEIAKAATDLSRRTEQQAAGLEQTAAALHEISSTVQRGARNTKEATGTANGAKADAGHSSTLMAQATSAMGDIESSSAKINQIIGVIDEIAFQTNLLALNAGVEAARAGDAGRGFAVVASEVRALAQRSAEAAKEIKSLISTSSGQVQQGARLVTDTSASLGVIAEKIAQIDQIIAEMAASTQQQSTAITEVTTAVNEMDTVTQRNAAMVEETSATARSLGKQAEGLAELVASFELSSAGPDASDKGAAASRIVPLYTPQKVPHELRAHG